MSTRTVTVTTRSPVSMAQVGDMFTSFTDDGVTMRTFTVESIVSHGIQRLGVNIRFADTDELKYVPDCGEQFVNIHTEQRSTNHHYERF